ncbi:MAG TPA: Holliday junction resolvase RuvX [Firmicutes bacterium]|nr:Holliday junction resolvase RuvX [Candidatus Fermentithermobacillaceae bacterium]
MGETGKIIGVDLGLKRVGVSISDETNILASPLATLPYRGPETLAEELTALAREHGASSFVIGFPKNMDGTLGPAGKRARRFAALLERHSGLNVFLYDERLTTSQVEKEMIALGKSRRLRKETIDGAAAALILENYLRAMRNRAPHTEGL